MAGLLQPARRHSGTAGRLRPSELDGLRQLMPYAAAACPGSRQLTVAYDAHCL